jgi:hypothetical protein
MGTIKLLIFVEAFLAMNHVIQVTFLVISRNSIGFMKGRATKNLGLASAD